MTNVINADVQQKCTEVQNNNNNIRAYYYNNGFKMTVLQNTVSHYDILLNYHVIVSHNVIVLPFIV